VIISGAAVTRLREARKMTLAEVAAGMRRRGLPYTSASFVAIAERDLWVDVEPEWVSALAGALGSDLAEVTDGQHLTLVVVEP